MTKETILAVQDYFKQKLLNGEFEIIEFSEHISTVLIDGEFVFEIWTASGAPHLEIYNHKKSFMNIPFEEAEKEFIWRHFEQPINDWRNGDLRSQKLAAYEKLKKELQLDE